MNVPDEWTLGTVHANGIDLQYYRTGEGPPLVLAHGFYDNGRCWEPLVTDLADDYDVVAYDARGHGRSDAPETGYGIDDRVADLVGLVDALGLDDPILLGHSMGGATVGWAAAEHPDLPQAVVLEDPAALSGQPPMGPDERADHVREALTEDAELTVEERIEEQYDGFDPEQARRHAVADTELDPNIAEIAREGYPENLSDRLGDVTVPTLLLRRDADVAQRVEDLQLTSELQNGRVVHVPNAGHCVFHTQYEAAFAELEAFLAWVAADAPSEPESRN
ncbi:alpha/beta fold hydrolase [Halomarina oriensis]|uniref:Alpha/beta fold hydrolase n=1 Tax=Halomarina oriensis TaxID=671145 RepID=A0A6B0GV46_9EURY|nr:alpha/beta hydrolase [Halomarina oriensis]MWG35985.1 alpha/beta fold hydrolase [Halomarina oriensis]